MVWQRWRSLIACLQPVLAKVRCRISESSTLCVRHHLPRASQPQHTSELLEQQRLLARRIADLQGREISPLHSLTGLLCWDQTGNKNILHPSSILQRHKHNPHQFTHCLFHHKQQAPFPVLSAGKEGTQTLLQVNIRAWDRVMGAAPAPCSWLCSPSGAPTPTLLCPCPQPSWSAVVAQRKLMCQTTPALFPAGMQEKDA